MKCFQLFTEIREITSKHLPHIHQWKCRSVFGDHHPPSHTGPLLSELCGKERQEQRPKDYINCADQSDWFCTLVLESWIVMPTLSTWAILVVVFMQRTRNHKKLQGHCMQRKGKILLFPSRYQEDHRCDGLLWCDTWKLCWKGVNRV